MSAEPADNLSLLARVPLLRALPDELLRQLSGSLAQRALAAGTPIFSRGDPALRSPDASLLLMRELVARLRNTTSLLAQRASRDVVSEIDAKMTRGERFAILVADWNGSWAFMLALLVLSGGWMAVNAFGATSFDPYPYVFFNLVLAILMVLQAPLLMMAQNRENRQERARAEVDFRVNLKNEVAIERLGIELERVGRELAAVRSTLGDKR